MWIYSGCKKRKCYAENVNKYFEGTIKAKDKIHWIQSSVTRGISD